MLAPAPCISRLQSQDHPAAARTKEARTIAKPRRRKVHQIEPVVDLSGFAAPTDDDLPF
jgi:hypothetical protein